MNKGHGLYGIGKDEVSGSIPDSSSTKKPVIVMKMGFFVFMRNVPIQILSSSYVFRPIISFMRISASAREMSSISSIFRI